MFFSTFPPCLSFDLYFFVFSLEHKRNTSPFMAVVSLCLTKVDSADSNPCCGTAGAISWCGHLAPVTMASTLEAMVNV